MLISHLVLAFLWVLYGVLHSVLAAIKTKAWAKRTMGAGYKHYRLLYTMFAFIAMVGVIAYQLSIDTALLFTPNFFSYIAGGLVALSGLLLMLVCIKKYFMSLSGLRSLLHETVYTELQISGIHRYVRHPLYLGTFAFLWGLLVLFPYTSLLVCCVVITGYTLLALRFEEKKLIMDFGEAYRVYRQTVPALLPRLNLNGKSVQH